MAKALGALKKLSASRATSVEIPQIMLDIQRQSDRGACIVMVAFTDGMLAKSLSYRLKGVEEDEIFGEFKPLYSLDSKIVTGQAIGIYGPETRKFLVALKDLRNFFAHSSVASNFDTPEVSNYCDSQFGNIAWLSPLFDQIVPIYGSGKKYRDLVIINAICVCIMLNYSLGQYELAKVRDPAIHSKELDRLSSAFEKFSISHIRLPLP